MKMVIQDWNGEVHINLLIFLQGNNRNSTKIDINIQMKTRQSPKTTNVNSSKGSYFSAQAIYPQLTINQPDEDYEQEADAKAQRVMTMPEGETIQRKCAACEEEEKRGLQGEPRLQRQPASTETTADEEELTVPLMTKAEDAGRLTVSNTNIQIQKEEEEEDTPPPPMRVNGDRVRESPDGGFDIGTGTLHWKLEFKGIRLDSDSESEELRIILGKDVEFEARFIPAAGQNCPRITFVQSVLATTGGVEDTGHLLYTWESGSRKSMDTLHSDTEPYYGAEGRPESQGAGLQGSTGQTIGTAQGSNRTAATHGDGPYIHRVPAGATAVRRFEAAVICVETGETWGSIEWGYTKRSDGTITLLGGQTSDVHINTATAELESVRQAYYQGAFQHSLNNFAVGSSTLTAAHRSTLRTINTQNLRRIVLVGANDNSGGQESNANLSLERARAVKRFLTSQMQVPASLIRVEGHGVAARVPNPPGQQVAANRRVDVRIERGQEVGSIINPRPQTNLPPGTNRERNRINAQNPWFTAAEAVEWIIRLDNQSQVTTGEWVQLLNYLNALDTWRATDPTVPDVRSTHRAAIQRIQRKLNTRTPRTRPDFGRPSIRDLTEDTPNLIERIPRDAERIP